MPLDQRRQRNTGCLQIQVKKSILIDRCTTWSEELGRTTAGTFPAKCSSPPGYPIEGRSQCVAWTEAALGSEARTWRS